MPPGAVIPADCSYVLVAPSTRAEPVKLWTARRLPFETDQSVGQREMVRAVGAAVGSLALEPEDSLRGLFISSQTTGRQPDAENITFYNWRGARGRSPFEGPLTLQFERSFESPPQCPVDVGKDLAYHHVWMLEGGGDWLHWTSERVLAAWDAVRTPVAFGEDAGRHVWRAMVEQPRTAHIHVTGAFEGLFAAEVVVSTPVNQAGSALEALKGSVDGPIAAFQRFSPDQLELAKVIMGKHAAWKRWRHPITADRLVELAHTGVGRVVFAGNPFNPNGLDPCDDRCVAGRVTVRLRKDLAQPEVSGRLVALGPKQNDGLNLSSVRGRAARC
jgi:hypothetical protein